MAIKPVEILIKAKDEASGVFGLLRKNAVELGATIAGYFGVKAFVGAVQGAAEFEAKLSEVKAVANATAEELQLLRAAAENAGATTKFTATESADALGNLARAGLTARQAIDALPATLQLAQAGGLGLAESSEIVTKTLAGFNLQAAEAGRIADVLAQGANASNTSVLGLGQALSYAAPTAVSLGLSLETTVAIIGKFADAGIDASRAGTALNAILSQFSDPASRFRQELAAMGITTNNFETALRQLAAAGPAGQKAVLAVGTEAGPALRALLNQGIGALDELKTKLDEAGGSAAATAATMENNLLGSLSGLSSIWDTVKNTLATPVLPVLKDGVERLTAALRGAVESGIVARFGDAIARGFQAALTWAQRFLAEVDFDALATRMGNAADRAGAAFESIAQAASNAGNAVKAVWGTASAGVNGFLAIVYTVGEAFAGVASNIQSGIALILQGLSKITFGQVSRDFEEAANTIRTSAKATWASSEALAGKALESFQGMADGAQMAREGWAGLNGDTAEAATQGDVAARAFQQVGETLKEMGGDAEAAGMKAQAAAIAQAKAAKQVQQEVRILRQEYEAALAAGDVQLALTKLDQMKKALSGVAGEATETKDKIEAAFAAVGIKTKAELEGLATKAKGEFDLIQKSGQATSDGLAAAWKRAADAAIEATGGIAPAWVTAQAGARGFEVATDAAGKTIVRAMNEAKTATEGAGNAANGAAGGYRNMAQAAEQAAAAAKKVAEINSRYASPLGASKYDRAKNPSVTGNTREERLAGQNAVDNSLQFTLRDKLNAGSLTEEDLADLENVVAALQQREQIDRDVDRMSPGSFSLAGMRDRAEWQAVRSRFQDAIANLGGSTAPTVGRTVQVNINTGRGVETVNTDEAGAAALVRSLQIAGLSSRG